MTIKELKIELKRLMPLRFYISGENTALPTLNLKLLLQSDVLDLFRQCGEIGQHVFFDGLYERGLNYG